MKIGDKVKTIWTDKYEHIKICCPKGIIVDKRTRKRLKKKIISWKVKWKDGHTSYWPTKYLIKL